MDKMKYTLRLLGGVTLFLVCGCHSPYSYQPYGYTGSPGYYAPMQPYQGGVYPGVQPGGVYPGTTYPQPQPGAYPPVIQGQPLVPGGSIPGSTYDPLYVPGSTGSTWSPTDDTLGGSGTFDDGGSIDPVPTPRDAEPYDDDPMFKDDNGLDSFGSRDDDDDDGFALPVAARPTVQMTSHFSHDPGFRRLSGILKRDAKTNQWTIVYELNSNDRYHGDLLIANREKCAGLRDGEIVAISGEIEPEMMFKGEPTFRIDSVARNNPREIQIR